MSKMIPVTILTGFLGSGKTTLLKRILTERNGMKIAVIENEFGEENIDNDILVQDGNEQIVQMSNGCICCTIRGDLVAGLADLLTRRDKGEIAFDRLDDVQNGNVVERYQQSVTAVRPGSGSHPSLLDQRRHDLRQKLI